ncbi:hypothetical protein E4T38_07139 [Aureobasidium subglaciale]|nr:hypothetical protein E4T38_07139 [Aureobasidium subglaciale]KAI5217928.1 hypothetical protein E4T40_07168 [Aureobasidium subglaciale]KAI5221402.1 hypothetical protein E4T41_07088 [Aureobasidium subglaciale]KAI5258981.1 hypothetical protein E4T46_07047 [Aureobasidium subglaciale]
MVAFMTEKLNITSPYRQCPPYGVPCPFGSTTLHLSARREKWWQMLEDLAWKERVMMQAYDAEQQQKREKDKAQTEQWMPCEQRKERKDSLIPAEKDEVVGTKGVAVKAEDASAASAVYDSDDEDAPPEQIAGYGGSNLWAVYAVMRGKGLEQVLPPPKGLLLGRA